MNFPVFLKLITIKNYFKITIITAGVLSILTVANFAMAQEKTHTSFFEGTDHELNVYRIYGKEPGKTLLFIGGIQGDEPGGFISADHYADISLAKGNLIVVPRANFQSILLNRRQINDDMNRKFAGDRRNNFETKIVAILKKLIKESDGLLNLHDGSGFFAEKWNSSIRNPMRFGQSIIADCETYKNPVTGKTINLGEIARSVCQEINRKIKDPKEHFHFNNHRTREKNSTHKEQRKSATYYALYTCGIPAFGIETSKQLPLESKVRQHNLAINAFMEKFGIIPETPGIKISPPVLNYLVVSVNDLTPVVVKNGQALKINSGDSILISHIEANYERGLSADIAGYGSINDLRKKIRITKATKVIVRKDYYPCGNIKIVTGKNTHESYGKIAVADIQMLDGSLLFFKIKHNGNDSTFQNYDHVKVVKGDTLEIVDVISGFKNPSSLVVNLKGFVGNTDNNTGEDRGYIIDTARDLWKRYSMDKQGKQYQAIVSYNHKIVGKLFIDLIDPVLKYVVFKTGSHKMECLIPGDSALINSETVLNLIDINTNIQQNLGVKAYISGPGIERRLLAMKDPLAMNNLVNPVKNKPLTRYKISVERNKIFLGSIDLNYQQRDDSP